MSGAITIYTRDQLERAKARHADVPCDGCTACCQSDACRMLVNGRCSIYATRPDICRRMDCRVLTALVPEDRRSQRVRENPRMAAVYEAGTRLAHTLRIA